MAKEVSDYERRILEKMDEDEAGFEYYTFALPHPKEPNNDLHAAFMEGERKHTLDGLKRRGLINAAGRGRERTWWITDEGKEAIA